MQLCLAANRQQLALPGYFCCCCYLWLSPSGLLLLELRSVLFGVPGVELLEGRTVLVGVECRLFLLSINLDH